MSANAMQVAVACGWICILNVLTVLALKVLNRESHDSPHLVERQLVCSCIGVTIPKL